MEPVCMHGGWRARECRLGAGAWCSHQAGEHFQWFPVIDSRRLRRRAPREGAHAENDRDNKEAAAAADENDRDNKEDEQEEKRLSQPEFRTLNSDLCLAEFAVAVALEEGVKGGADEYGGDANEDEFPAGHGVLPLLVRHTGAGLI